MSVLVSAALSFTFGSYGDFASVFSSASALRQAIVAIAGSSNQLSALISDIDEFTKALQTARATFDSATDAPTSLRNALGVALGKCDVILNDAKKKIDAYSKKLSLRFTGGGQGGRYRIAKTYVGKHYAIILWEIFGGKAEVEDVWRRVNDQLRVINTLLLSLQCDTLQRSEFQAKSIAADVNEIKSTVDKINSRIYELHKPIVYVTPFYFPGSNGKDILPVAGLTIADFSELFEILRESDHRVSPLDSSSMSSQLSHLHHTSFRSNHCRCSIYPFAHDVVMSFSWFFHPSGSPHQTPAILISAMSLTVVRSQSESDKNVLPLADMIRDDPGLKQAVSMMRGDWTASWKEQRANCAMKPKPQRAAALASTEHYWHEPTGIPLGICINQSLKRIDTMFEWSFGQPTTLRAPRRKLGLPMNPRSVWFKQAGGHLGIPLRLLLSCNGDCDMISALLENTRSGFESLRNGWPDCEVIIKMEGMPLLIFRAPSQSGTRTRAELLRDITYAFRKLFEREDREKYCGSIRPDDVVIIGCAVWKTTERSRPYAWPIWSVRKSGK